MCWKIWENKNKGCSNNLEMIDHHPIFVRGFYLLSITLLSLLLPLSFLLLARLSSAHYLLSLGSEPPRKSLLCSLFLYSNPNLLHVLVAFVSLATLINGLMGRIGPLSEPSRPVFRPRLHAAWILLCTLQGCVALGIEASIKAGVNGAGFGEGRSMVSKVVFFLGLHETMIHWARIIVRPVVDDTVFGGPREEWGAERWALAACFGALSWWRLRGEVDALAGVVVAKRDIMMKIELGDFLGWWLYYMTVVIGIIRIMKGIIWLMMIPFIRRQIEDDYAIDIRESEHKDEDRGWRWECFADYLPNEAMQSIGSFELGPEGEIEDRGEMVPND
ncbi:hypothetical protein Cgig2_000741 [Carnegiea gigantea]|uniref:Transmembrane protein n=1 Tax=Carnegiea gigantea TaxID=171969 RepID=A0A9Q1KDI9_9CARY|nr:hypothetical protein Cgig2_000741 [Carnegiea gigantea]